MAPDGPAIALADERADHVTFKRAVPRPRLLLRSRHASFVQPPTRKKGAPMGPAVSPCEVFLQLAGGLDKDHLVSHAPDLARVGEDLDNVALPVI